MTVSPVPPGQLVVLAIPAGAWRSQAGPVGDGVDRGRARGLPGTPPVNGPAHLAFNEDAQTGRTKTRFDESSSDRWLPRIV
ncbi:MAG: hypothetical protein CMJ70_28340 [Planctomycetaceae bacterium]|nr:hypothetical protein [Planctomycetaceae bacterium]